MPALPAGTLDPRSGLIMVYAMCGFANFGSVGILIAGMSALMPERRDEIVPLALRALVSGTLASGLVGVHDRASQLIPTMPCDWSDAALRDPVLMPWRWRLAPRPPRHRGARL